MLAYIRGTLVAKSESSVVIDVSGIGYSIEMSARNLAGLRAAGSEVKVYTILAVKDDAPVLYGFLSQEEKELFTRLTSVSGVGPKVALAALSFYSAAEIITAITDENVAAIQRVPGVGKKTASRIVLELKGSVSLGAQELLTSVAQVPNAAREGVSEALFSMGFTQAEVTLALQGASASANEAELLQYALKRLGE